MSLSTRWVVQIDQDGLQFEHYPYPGARVFPSGRISPDQILDVDLSGAPPTVRVGEELLFVPAPQRAGLEALCRSRGLATVQREDVWSALLEPFLDTVQSPEAERGTLGALARWGFEASEVESLRARYGPRVLRYNSVLWDWVHLGLMDLLEASRLPFSTGLDFERTYREGMAVALRGPVTAA